MLIQPVDPDKHINVQLPTDTFRWTKTVTNCAECPSYIPGAWGVCSDTGTAVKDNAIARTCPRIKRSTISALDMSKYVDWRDVLRENIQVDVPTLYTCKNGIAVSIKRNPEWTFLLIISLNYKGKDYTGTGEIWSNSVAIPRDKLQFDIKIPEMHIAYTSKCDYDFGTALFDALEYTSSVIKSRHDKLEARKARREQ